MESLSFVNFILLWLYSSQDRWDDPIVNDIEVLYRKNYVIFAISDDCNFDCFESMLDSYILTENKGRLSAPLPQEWTTEVNFGGEVQEIILPNQTANYLSLFSEVSF